MSALQKMAKGKYVLSRSMLLETFFRFSTYLFTNSKVMKGKLTKIPESESADQNAKIARSRLPEVKKILSNKAKKNGKAW